MPLIKPHFSSLRLEATSACNHRCSYCFASASMTSRKSQDLTLDEIRNILDKARRHKIKKVLFSGGEPFTRRDFVEILQAAHGISTSFVTNGSLITDQSLADMSSERHIVRIRFSMDGFEGHDKMRIGSSWRHVMNRIEACRRYCPKKSCVVQTTASPAVLNEIPALLEKLESLGVDRWRMFLVRYGGKGIDTTLNFDSNYYRNYVKLLQTIASMVRERRLTMQIEADGGFQSDLEGLLGRISPPEFNHNTHPCRYLLHVLMVRSNGDLSVCPFFEFGVGNIRDFENISNIEVHSPIVAWRNFKTSDIAACQRCRYARICNGGCRKTALEMFGSFKAEDPIYCFMFPLIEKTVWPILPSLVQDHYKRLLVMDGVMPQWTAEDLDALLSSPVP